VNFVIVRGVNMSVATVARQPGVVEPAAAGNAARCAERGKPALLVRR
jgi:hypothetical protein